MQETIENLIQKIKISAQGRITGFVIGNTSSDMPLNQDFYETPLEMDNELVYAGVIVKNIETASWIAKLVDGQVDYIFVDAEKKIKKIYYGFDDAGNIEREVRKKISQSQVAVYKGNSLAVEAVDLLLEQLVVDSAGLEVAIIGAGNIGSKIALKLVERGAQVRLFRRNLNKLKKITEGLNQIKSEHTISVVTMAENVEEACRGASVVIGCSDQKSISKDDLKYLSTATKPVLIDVGKKCFDESVIEDSGFNVFLLDLAIIQKCFFSAILKTQQVYGQSIGRRLISDYNLSLITQGLIGCYGEIVVDDIEKPTKIIGIADGNGSLLRDQELFNDKLKILAELFNINKL